MVLSIAVASFGEVHVLRNTSLLYRPSAAMTDEVRLVAVEQICSTPTCDPKVGFPKTICQLVAAGQTGMEATYEGKFAPDILPSCAVQATFFDA